MKNKHIMENVMSMLSCKKTTSKLARHILSYSKTNKHMGLYLIGFVVSLFFGSRDVVPVVNLSRLSLMI